MLLRGENDINRDFAMDRQESICFVGSDRIFLLSQWQWVGKLLNVDNGCETRSPNSNSHPLCYWWQSLKSGRYIWRFSNLAHVLSCNKVLAIAISSSPNLRVVPTKKVWNTDILCGTQGINLSTTQTLQYIVKDLRYKRADTYCWDWLHLFSYQARWSFPLILGPLHWYFQYQENTEI